MATHHDVGAAGSPEADAGRLLGHVTVAITTYNGVSTIRQTLDSALGQRYPDFSVTVFDDGSTDGTLDVVESYGDRVRLVRNERRLGLTANWARASGSGQGAGPYVAVLHMDDLWHPDFLRSLVLRLATSPGARIAFCNSTEVDASGQDRPRITSARRTIDRPGPVERSWLRRLYRGNAIYACAWVACSDLFLRFPWDERYTWAPDWDLWLRLASSEPGLIVAEPRVLAAARDHGSNATYSREVVERRIHEEYDILRRAFERDRVGLPRRIAELAVLDARAAFYAVVALRGRDVRLAGVVLSDLFRERGLAVVPGIPLGLLLADETWLRFRSALRRAGRRATRRS